MLVPMNAAMSAQSVCEPDPVTVSRCLRLTARPVPTREPHGIGAHPPAEQVAGGSRSLGLSGGATRARGACFVAVAGALLLAGCLSEKTRRCHHEMGGAQEIVAQTQSESLESVNASIGAVEGALAACSAAGRDSEVEELQKAKKQLTEHRDRLERRGPKRQRSPRTAEELATLVAQGDPSCPRGQAYRDRESGKQIRCVGRHVVEMTRTEIEALYRKQGYRVTGEETPPRVRAEYGADIQVFQFRSGGASELPECVELFPAPGISWQEAVARATGARPDKLDGAKTIRTSRGNLALDVVDSEKKVVARIGNCGT